jgi:hypothetical protein
MNHSEESEMADLKPSKSYFSKAVRDGRYFLGQFSMPGMAPDYVREGGAPVRYDTEDDAETAAMWALTSALQSRIYDERKPGPYRHMTAEFAIALAKTGLTATEFGVIGGWPQSRVIKWVEGEADVPHHARIMVTLFASPIILNEARKITDHAMKGGNQ